MVITNSTSIVPILHLHTKPTKNKNKNKNSSYNQLIIKKDTIFIKTNLSFSTHNATQRLRSVTLATVLHSPAAPVTEKASTGQSPKWSSRAIKSFAMAEIEARKLKYPKTGSEALLMGILIEGTSIAAKSLRASGVTLFKVREETVKLLGKSDMYYFSPEHPPLTQTAQRAIDWATEEKLKSGKDGELTVSHILLGIWSEKESAGRKLMASLGFDDDKAKELAKTMDKDIILSFK